MTGAPCDFSAIFCMHLSSMPMHFSGVIITSSSLYITCAAVGLAAAAAVPRGGDVLRR